MSAPWDHELDEAEFRRRVRELPSKDLLVHTLSNTAMLLVFLAVAAKIAPNERSTKFSKDMAIADLRRAIAALDRNDDEAVKQHMVGAELVAEEKALRAKESGVPEGLERTEIL